LLFLFLLLKKSIKAIVKKCRKDKAESASKE